MRSRSGTPLTPQQERETIWAINKAITSRNVNPPAILEVFRWAIGYCKLLAQSGGIVERYRQQVFVSGLNEIAKRFYRGEFGDSK